MKRPIVQLDIRVIFDKKKYQVEVRDTGRHITTSRGFFQSPQGNTNEGIFRSLNELVEYDTIIALL